MFSISLILLPTIAICFGAPLLASDKTDAVQEVQYGETAILHCQSNLDKDHLFMFWELANNDDGIVGPGNKFNRNKYNYEVLSGNLTIRTVSLDQAGIYKCVSHGVKKYDDFNIRSVRMVVEKDWEDVYEHDANTNLFRVVLIIGSIVVIMGGGYLIYTVIRRRDYTRAVFMDSEDDDDDDSAEVFRAPGTSKGTGNIILDNAAFDGGDMQTDFKKVLNNSRNDI